MSISIGAFGGGAYGSSAALSRPPSRGFSAADTLEIAAWDRSDAAVQAATQGDLDSALNLAEAANKYMDKALRLGVEEAKRSQEQIEKAAEQRRKEEQINRKRMIEQTRLQAQARQADLEAVRAKHLERVHLADFQIAQAVADRAAFMRAAEEAGRKRARALHAASSGSVAPGCAQVQGASGGAPLGASHTASPGVARSAESGSAAESSAAVISMVSAVAA